MPLYGMGWMILLFDALRSPEASVTSAGELCSLGSLWRMGRVPYGCVVLTLCYGNEASGGVSFGVVRENISPRLRYCFGPRHVPLRSGTTLGCA